MRLQNNMFHIVRQDDTPAFDIALHADHVIYRAHFPGQPVTPGVCILQIIGELLEEHLHQALQLCQVKNLKFVRPLSPVDNNEVTVAFRHIDTDGDTVKTKGDITAEGATFTSFSIIYAKGD
ncbi:MAG: beta-hydroxyacyl-ACP dehydratase [Prevotella sp.]|nr:beta-hydroxyacyl-ACP dehydratase [Prevotella sp.]